MDYVAPTASHEMAQEPLVGTEEANVDEKGRIRLSVKKQDRLGRNFVLVQDAVGCLIAYPQKIWRQKLHEIMSRPASAFEREVETRDLGGMSEDDINCDAQGRFVIPVRFRDSLHIGKEVVLVGAIDRVEVWPKTEFAKFTDAKAQYGRARREAAEKGLQPGIS
jgi:MraZ protein